MRLLFICLTLTALLQQNEAAQEVEFQVPKDQNITLFKRETKALESGDPKKEYSGPINKKANETDIQPFPPIRCLGCDQYCKSFDDGMDENGKGTRLCHVKPGVLHGCISIFMYGLRRKCVTEMDMKEKAYCEEKENAHLCIKCAEPDCNNVKLTTDGVQKDGCAPVSTSLLLLLSTCLICWLVMRE